MIQIKRSQRMASKRKKAISDDEIRQQLMRDEYEILNKYNVIVTDLKKMQTRPKYQGKTVDELAKLLRDLYMKNEVPPRPFDSLKQDWLQAIETLREIRNKHPSILKEVIEASSNAEEWRYILDQETPLVSEYLWKIWEIPQRRSSSEETKTKKGKGKEIVMEDESIPENLQIVSEIAKLAKKYKNAKSSKQKETIEQQINQLQQSQSDEDKEKQDLINMLGSEDESNKEKQDLINMLGGSEDESNKDKQDLVNMLGDQDSAPLDALEDESGLPLQNDQDSAPIDALEDESALPLDTGAKPDQDSAPPKSDDLDEIINLLQDEEAEQEEQPIPDKRKIDEPSSKKLAEDIQKTADYLRDLSQTSQNQLTIEESVNWHKQLTNCFFPNVVLS